MARTPASLRAWAKASPEELKELEAEDALYKKEGMNTEDDESFVEGQNDETPTNTKESMPAFDPEEAEMRAEELAVELENGGGDDSLISLIEDYDPVDGSPRWVADEELWNGSVDVASDVREPADPIFWQLATHIYDYLGGEILDPEAKLPEMGEMPEEEEPLA